MKNVRTSNRLTEITEKFRDAGNKLTLLDFDGTLVDFASDATDAVPSKELLDLLQKVADIPGNHLIIITGRQMNEIDKMVGHLPIDIIAEHGAMIREKAIWKTLIEGKTEWKKEVFPIIMSYNIINPNSFIEEKSYSLAWHYRNVEPKTGKADSRGLIKVLSRFTLDYDLKILDGNKVVEIICKNVNKGSAVLYLLNKMSYDFILSMGDDITDEDMFRILLDNNKAYTVKIGPGDTCARYRLAGIQQVIALLERFLIETG